MKPFMCTHTYMGTVAKNISLSELAYQKLAKDKRPSESFSDAILRLLDKKKPLSEVIGKKLIDASITLDDIRKASKNTLERISNESP